MKQSPAETFGRAVRFAGLDYTKEQIKKALDRCTFEELQRQEKEKGFHEKSLSSEFFFRKGEVGSWREELTEAQARKIIRDQREVMLRFGYLGEDGDVVF